MWAGRVVFGVIVVGLVVYLSLVGLDKADKLGSSIGGVVALVALVAPYLLPARREDSPVADDIVVENSGDAQATGGGQANTGAETPEGDTATIRVTGSGNAVADGSGSEANTGVRRIPRS